MRLLQLNAWQLRLAKKVEDMISLETPDIICLQEICDAKNELGFITTLTELQQDIKYAHQYYSPVYSFDFMDETVGFGSAIIANQAFATKSSTFTSGQYKNSFTLNNDDYNVRNFQHVTVSHNNEFIHIINHHGYHVPNHKNGNEHTLKACQQIADYIAKLDGPIIVAGDFNLTPNSESIEVLNGRLRNLSIEYNLQTTRNDLTTKTEVCDYIFVNDKVKVNDFYISDVVASDHQGLVLEFDI
ncbi:MAG TPA: endonuclease/exonuclease/phosphatase family protein [Candidatus Saccharibacteria bacterium]|nr:endonuclease/exonuclease/phosphatase family protein [Candidatus Saccharibacteria bacterium]HRQ07196.1 endonuclease/exonuclease/phosphatase family protein [Candidatus Saccharibacteria bacterium]